MCAHFNHVSPLCEIHSYTQDRFYDTRLKPSSNFHPPISSYLHRFQQFLYSISLVRSALPLCKSMKTIIDRDIVYVYIYIYTRINFFSASIHIPARSCVRDRAIYLGSVRKRIRNMISTHVRRKKFDICGALLRIGILALWDYHYVWQISIIERLHVSGTKSGNIV